ncbi:MAG: hypothetical protein KGV57_02010 [Fusobacterium sp.]|nr:hypothetical protein [Fusobacterium sp.]
MKTMSVKFQENTILDIKKISEIFNISYSDFIREAVEREIKIKKQDFMFKMSNVPYCDEEEEKEIIDFLNSLTDEDLEIAKREIIKL